jgi:DNA-binding NarL/FixJ family response regulator
VGRAKEGKEFQTGWGRSPEIRLCFDVHVLIADSQRDLGGSLAVLVEKCGHEVLAVVGSGLEAIQAHARLRPDVVLMEYSLPRFNGAIASRIILAKDPNMKIIIFSAAAPAIDLASAGVVAILRKPVGLDKLYAALYDAGSRRSEPPNTSR